MIDIRKVDKTNEYDWASLCVKLFKNTTVSEMIEEKNSGRLSNEYLYYIDNKPIAFISLSLRHDYVEGCDFSPVAYLEGIFVEEEYRNQGIGTNLISFAKEFAKKNNAHELASDCEILNIDSFAFHLKMGFYEVNRTIHFKSNI